jgi:hypothetical protein
MVAQLSLITSVLLASSTTTTSGAASTSTSTSTLSNSSTSSQITTLIGSISATASQNSTGVRTSLGSAQTTVSLFNACYGSNSACSGIQDLTYYGAVVTANPTKTVYALGCVNGQSGSQNATQCFDTPLTVTAGPSLFALVDSTGQTPVTISCDVEGKTKSAVCQEKSTTKGFGGPTGTGSSLSAGATNSANSSVGTTTLSFNSSQINYNKLVITKGAQLLNATNTATKTPIAPTCEFSPLSLC